MSSTFLPIANLAERHIGLTYALAECYFEAACVCLDRFHVPPEEFLLKSKDDSKVNLTWKPPRTREIGAWANRDDATRDGAYACAIAAVELVLGMFAVRRAETLTGADYYIASINKRPDDLETCCRLEVSGTNLDKNEVKRRLKAKIQQLRDGQSNLPAMAAIIGFQVKIILLESI